MKKHLYLLLLALVLAFAQLRAQNAQQFFYNQLAFEYDYQAASFVIDTPPDASSSRAFLLWSKNFTNPQTTRSLTLDQFDQAGNFISSQYSQQYGKSTADLLPKKIIKAQHAKGYYLLGYVHSSNNPIGGIYAYSSPLVIRLDEHLNPVWVNRVHFAAIDNANRTFLIEYNDIIEARNGDIVLGGRFSAGSNGQRRLLLTRLNQSGSVLWALQYNLTGCHSQILSLAEAGSGNIVTTGEIELCSGDTDGGPRRMLYAAFNSAGAPVVAKRFGGTLESSGNKIVRHTNTPGNDAFFIAGYMDIANATGIPDRQILLMDITEGGGPIFMHHIGNSGTEVASDIISKDLGNNTYALYLTGHTTSYAEGYPLSDPFYLQLQLRYSDRSLHVNEFSTFPRPNTSYLDRAGLEIKKAGNNRFAILGNAKCYFSSPQPDTRTHTNVFIRDLSDSSGSCIALHQPPVTEIRIGFASLTCSPSRWTFASYPGVFEPFASAITVQADCGNFFIDPYPTSDTVQALQTITRSKEPAAKVRVYPNPVSNELYIDYGAVANSGRVIARVYATDMRLMKEYVLPGGNRNSISLQGLTSGLYFLQLENKGATQVFQIKKN